MLRAAMSILPPDHAERFVLADEVHARPPEALDTPCRASCISLLVDPDDRARELAHLGALYERHGMAPPPPGTTHLSVRLGPLRLKWERHGEFSSYFFIAPGLSPRPFSEPVVSMLPPGWLSQAPGQTMFAGHAKLVRDPNAGGPPVTPDAAFLAAHFGGNMVVGSVIGDGAGLALTDFRIHDDGFARMLILDRGLTARQAGRTLQRLFEIEAYRIMALLAFPIARRQSPRIVAIERSLAELTDHIAGDGGQDEPLLHELTRLAAEVESGLAASQFRFGACRAYADLVRTRIEELREQRLPGLQTLAEFMARRFTPAVATVASVEQRLHDLSERVSQASGLLSTRVSIARERQSQDLLTSMDKRARLQLRLQQTVEGLSVAAIVYYASGLVSYLAKAAKAAGAPINADLLVGLSIPVLLGGVVWAVHRARRRITEAEAGAAPHSPNPGGSK